MDRLKVFEELTLPNGVQIRNRIFESAMSETLANKRNEPTRLHENLYGTWARGGSAIVVTGNVMVDRTALGEPGNVVVEDERDLDKLKQWASVGTQNNTHLWMQINHPGKQSPRSMSKEPVAPSAVPLKNYSTHLFGKPRALTV